MTRLMRNQRDGKGNYARAALTAYAAAAMDAGQKEYARDVNELANRAGPLHPNCKEPD